MSIEVHNGDNNSLSNSFTADVDASCFAMDIVEPVQLEPKEKKDIKPKEKEEIKPKKKFFHELLLESWNKGIANKLHSNGDTDRYSCPMLCVCDLLNIPIVGVERTKDMESHKSLYRKLSKESICIDTDLKCPECGEDFIGYFKEFEMPCGEISLGWHLASSHQMPNNKVAEILAALYKQYEPEARMQFELREMMEDHKKANEKELEAKRNQPQLERLRDEKGRYIKR